MWSGALPNTQPAEHQPQLICHQALVMKLRNLVITLQTSRQQRAPEATVHLAMTDMDTAINDHTVSVSVAVGSVVFITGTMRCCQESTGDTVTCPGEPLYVYPLWVRLKRRQLNHTTGCVCCHVCARREDIYKLCESQNNVFLPATEWQSNSKTPFCSLTKMIVATMWRHWLRKPVTQHFNNKNKIL